MFTEPLCFGDSNGTTSIGVKGGNPGYTYSWNTNPTQTTNPATGLKKGIYICTVTDANGCQSIVDDTINEPNKLILIARAYPAMCNGSCNGSVAVIPEGGTTPYSYLWNTASDSTDPDVENLCAGTYSVLITDFNGCTADSANLVVTQPPPLVITKTITDSSHCGQNDGWANINVTGGTPNYTYLWSDPSKTTNANVDSLLPGSYCVKVTDAQGCIDTACIFIGNVPSPIVIISDSTDVTCNGGNNGSATTGVKGGTPPYTYSWTNSSSTIVATTGATGNILPAGGYTVAVTDSGHCTSYAYITITQPTLVVTTVNPPPAICIGSSAKLDAASSGGVPPYTYTWSTGQSGSSITVSPVSDTTYTVTATLDSNKCPGAPVIVDVTVNPPLSLDTLNPDTICPGGTATLTATGSGGDGVYTYTWKPGNMTGATVTVSPKKNTTYTVTLKDTCNTPQVEGTVKVVIDPLPVVNFSTDTNIGCAPL